MTEEILKAAFWDFDARIKGHPPYRTPAGNHEHAFVVSVLDAMPTAGDSDKVDIKSAAVLKPLETLLTQIDKGIPWAEFIGSSIRCEGHGFRAEVVLRFFWPSPDTGNVLTGIFLDLGFSDVIVSNGIISGDNPVEEWEFTVSGLFEKRTEDEQG